MNRHTIRYLKYVLFSRHGRGYGIHSPFIFELVTGVFRNKTDPAVVLKIENIRKKNLSGSRIITVNDLGAGSAKMKRSSRKVSDIVRYSSVSRKYGRLLYSLAGRFGKPGIVELGTSAGISTMYLAAACPGSLVYTVEGSPATAELARENFTIAGADNIRLLTGSFDLVLPELAGKGISPGLVFIDGNHRWAPTLRYFDLIADMSGRDTAVVIDDIHSSEEMEEAWSEIKGDKRVSVTVDIFRMGIVFFREGTGRSHYIIRY